MKDTEIQLFLFKLIMFCLSMIILSFVARIVKILTTKKIEGVEDFMCVLFLIALFLPFVILYFYIKRKFKKEPEKPIKEDNNGIKDLFKM